MEPGEIKFKVTADMEETTRRLTLMVTSLKAAEDRVTALEARVDAVLQKVGKLETDRIPPRKGATKKG